MKPLHAICPIDESLHPTYFAPPASLWAIAYFANKHYPYMRGAVGLSWIRIDWATMKRIVSPEIWEKIRMYSI